MTDAFPGKSPTELVEVAAACRRQAVALLSTPYVRDDEHYDAVRLIERAKLAQQSARMALEEKEQ